MTKIKQQKLDLIKGVFFLCLLFTFSTSFSQTPAWQWINVGGSSGNPINDNIEGCKSIFTDHNGNIYGSSQLQENNISIDTIYKTLGFGYEDFCVFSYRKDGSFRWVRFFGQMYVDHIGEMVVDSDGNTYLTGWTAISDHDNCHLGDTIIPMTTTMFKYQFILKLDSTGHTVWVNFPGSDFIANEAMFYFNRVQFNNIGNPVVFGFFSDTCTLNGFSISTTGDYMLEFDKTSGTLLNITKLEIRRPIDFDSFFFTMDIDNSIYMWCYVEDTVLLGMDTAIHDVTNGIDNNLLIRFNPQGNVEWFTEVKGETGTNTFQDISGKPVIYGDFIYISGRTMSFPGTTFMGIPITNNLASNNYRRTKIFARFDKNTGDIVSAINLHSEDNVLSSALCVKNDKVYATCAGGTLIMLNQTDTIKPFEEGANVSNYPFVVEMDTALSQFNWGVAAISDNVPKVESITVDDNGSIYVGGYLENSIFNCYGEETPIFSAPDYFVAKISTDSTIPCDPTIANAQLVSLDTLTVTVNGTATNQPDSMYWYWGDGDSTLYQNFGTDISHTYQDTGVFTICLQAWNYCSEDNNCLASITATNGGTGIEESLAKQIQCNPNPFSESISVNHPEQLSGSKLEIHSLLGEKVFVTKLSGTKTEVNTNKLETGIYFIKIITSGNETYLKKIVKE